MSCLSDMENSAAGSLRLRGDTRESRKLRDHTTLGKRVSKSRAAIC